MKTYKEMMASSLSEMKLSRVFQHYNDSDTAILIISAFRDEYGYKQNVNRNKELARRIKKAGFGYVYVDGHWIDKDTGIDSEEDSIFVTSNESIKLKIYGIEWLHDYKQDAIIFKPANGTAFLIENAKYGGKEKNIGSFNVKTIEKVKSDLYKKRDDPETYGAGYTRLRKHGVRKSKVSKHFVFEDIIRSTKGWIYNGYHRK